MCAIVIGVEGLRKRFGDVRALDGATFSAAPGEITGFLGQNGAGKTTTMRILSTLLRPDGGSARVAGRDVVGEPEAVRRSVGLLTEEPGLYDRMTVREQLSFFAAAYGVPRERARARIGELSEMLGFEEHLDRRAGTLSKGNRQKVAVARALVHDPPVLLLDEPAAALDVVAAHAMEEFLRSDALRGKTVLLSTHVVEEAARLCARIVVIVRGRIVAAGTPREMAGEGDLRTALIRLMRPEEAA